MVGIGIGIGSPPVMTALELDCGCDACDSGSADLLDVIDQAFVDVVVLLPEVGDDRPLDSSKGSLRVLPDRPGGRSRIEAWPTSHGQLSSAMTHTTRSAPATTSTPIPDQYHRALVPRSALARPIPSLRTAMTTARPISPTPMSMTTTSPHHAHHENSIARAWRTRGAQ